jgi:deazaflavin-dependent oxidoreductase (nitroreductase family)
VSVEGRYSDEPYCYLTTTGRTSGLPREIEIWFGARGDTTYLLSGNGPNAHWVMNVMQAPRVRVRIADEEFAGVARVLEPGTEEQGCRPLLAAKYQDWHEGKPMSGWARTALPVAIDLIPICDRQ